MESNTWAVQDYVSKLSENTKFTAVDVTCAQRSERFTGASRVLNEMVECVKLIYQAKGRGHSNIYTKLPGPPNCSACDFRKSGSAGCVIRKTGIRAIYEANR